MDKKEERKPIYVGGWQFGDVIRQELPGPCGDGEVRFPNNDYFKGHFCLSYASIWGAAYLATGRYEFADGRYIEPAYVHFDKTGTLFMLDGFYRVKHPERPDSLVCIKSGEYYGIELVLADEPFIREWYAGEQIERESPLQLKRYELDDSKGDDFLALTLYLHGDEGDFEVLTRGGQLSTNQYDNNIFEPRIYQRVQLPNGNIYVAAYSCTALRQFAPYDGYVTYYDTANKQFREELWTEGVLEKAEEWVKEKVEEPKPEEEKTEEPVWEGEPIILHLQYGNRHWSISNAGEWEYEHEDRVAQYGSFKLVGFYSYEIKKIEADRITIVSYDETYYLTPDEPLHLYNEIEGREWSDGCVYDGDEYALHITWKK